MGWLWSSQSPNDESISKIRPRSEDTFAEPTLPPSTLPSSSSPQTTVTPPTASTPSVTEEEPSERRKATSPQTRDQKATAELLAYLQSIHRSSAEEDEDDDDDLDDDDEDDDSHLDTNRVQSNPISRLFASKSGPPSSKPTSSSHQPRPSELLTPSHLYPSTVNCQALFDQAFKCQSPGGQVLQVWRYGSTRNCAQHWNNFWWCMRTNHGGGLRDVEREERVRRRYWEQDQRVRQRREGCSEDVWRQRKRRVVTGVFVDGSLPEGFEILDEDDERLRTH